MCKRFYSTFVECSMNCEGIGRSPVGCGQHNPIDYCWAQPFVHYRAMFSNPFLAGRTSHLTGSNCFVIAFVTIFIFFFAFIRNKNFLLVAKKNITVPLNTLSEQKRPIYVVLFLNSSFLLYCRGMKVPI